MELDSRKKSRRDRMMRSNTFEMHEVMEIDGDRPERSKGVERLSHLMNGNNGSCLPDGMQRPEKI